MKHLWEINHPYYCAKRNYFAPGKEQPVQQFSCLSDFLSAEGEMDPDLNLVFRFDWEEGTTDGENDGVSPYNGDDRYRNGKLFVFIMGQRKGVYRWVEVSVCRADEPAVIEYLKPRWEMMQALWEPLSAF